MAEKQTKIHGLGAKKLSLTGKAFYQPNGQNSFPVNKPSLPSVIINPVPQPQIRYIMVQHPQFDTLVKEFTALRAMYNDLLTKFAQKNTQESLKANIEEVIESTHNIEAKMSRIVQDSNNNAFQKEEKENQPSIESEKARHEKQCLQIIQTVNRATNKIEELENRNKDLRSQIQSQKQWRVPLQKENKRLRLMLQTMQSQKQEEVQKLKREIKMIKESHQKNNSIVQSLNVTPKEVQANFTKQKIDNSQYLVESQFSNEEISGFSRLSINGDTTRKSRVYE